VPRSEGVITRVVREKTAAVHNEIDKRFFKFGVPAIAVVIHHNDVILAEINVKFADVLTRLWSGRDVNGKDSGAFKNLNKDGRGSLPIVIVLSVDYEQANLILGGSRRNGDAERQQKQRGNFTQFRRHGLLLFKSVSTTNVGIRKPPCLPNFTTIEEQYQAAVLVI
jgi:hypothetical protein